MSILTRVVKGKIEKPLRLLVYGVEGIGKSSFAAGAPATIFVGPEDGTTELDVTRAPSPEKGDWSWSYVLDTLTELATEKHEYKTVAIDTLDWLEPLCWKHVCLKGDENGKQKNSIEDFGYGKGFAAALEEWRVFLARLERLRNSRGMNVVLLAHSWIKPYKNPEGPDYDRHEMKLNAKASGLLREWCDAVLFANYETFAIEDKGRVRGVGNNVRYLYTQRSAARDAKNRYDLPEKLPLNWESFIAAVRAHRPEEPSKLRERINEMLTQVKDQDVITRVTAAVSKAAENAAELARIADHLAAIVMKESA